MWVGWVVLVLGFEEVVFFILLLWFRDLVEGVGDYRRVGSYC